MNFTSSVFLTIICLGQTLLAFGQCTFGNRDPGFTEVAPFSHNYVLGVKYNLPADRVINELNLWGLGTMARVQMAIYEDNSGKPAKLLASSVIDSVRTGVVSLSITPLSLKKGDYWIMAVYERSLRSGHTYYKTGVSNSIYYKQHGFGNAIPTDASDFDVYGGQDFQYWASSKTPQGTDVRSACDSFMWLDSIVYTSSNNTAKHALIGAASNGCDSVLTLDLILNHSARGSDVISACNSYQWIDGKEYTASTDTAVYRIPNGAANGCDSIVTLDLTIKPGAVGTDVQTACNGFQWIDGETYTANNSSAKHNLVGAAVNGCDSTVTLDLNILYDETAVDSKNACFSYTWKDGKTYTSSNNTAIYVIEKAAPNGCDSVLTLDLQLTSIDKSVTVAQDELTAQEPEASYQWLRCDNGFEPEQGATSRVFTARINGEYAVELTKDGCIDTTTCFAITEAGKPGMAIDQLKIFPNPSNENFVVSFGEKHRAVNIVITDISGKRIWESTFQNQQEVVISAVKTPGIYFLQINTLEGQKRTFRLVKE